MAYPGNPQYPNQWFYGSVSPERYSYTVAEGAESPAAYNQAVSPEYYYQGDFYFPQDSMQRTVGTVESLQRSVEEVKHEEPPERVVDYSLYDFPDPEILPPDRPQPKIIILEKNSAEIQNVRLDETMKKMQDQPKPAVVAARPVVADTIDCCKCLKKKSSSDIKCEKHTLCVDCCAEQYLAGDLFCPEGNCKQSWTMMQILKAHFVVCGESLPQYFQRRPAEPKIPMEGCICIGDDRKIRERLEEDKVIDFPKKGHLTYNKNLAMDACPKGHILCKPCAIRIVESEDKTCPECKSKLNFEPPAAACPEPDPAAAAKK